MIVVILSVQMPVQCHEIGHDLTRLHGGIEESRRCREGAASAEAHHSLDAALHFTYESLWARWSRVSTASSEPLRSVLAHTAIYNGVVDHVRSSSGLPMLVPLVLSETRVMVTRD